MTDLPLAALIALAFCVPNHCERTIERYHNAYFDQDNAFFEAPDPDLALHDAAMECIGGNE